MIEKQRPYILYLLSHYPCWSETFVRQDIALLQQLGVPLLVVSLAAGDCPMEPDWPQAQIVCPEEKSKFVSHRKGKWLDWIPRWGRALLSLFRYRKQVKQLVALCRHEKITHIHGEFGDVAALLASRVASQAGCTYSIGVHASDIYHLKYPPHWLFDKAAFLTICNRNAQQALLKQLPQVASKLHLIYHGVLMEEWSYFPREFSGTRFSILFVGRLVPKKGLAILLKAVYLLLNYYHSAVELTVVGEGELAKELRQVASSLNIGEWVHWQGAVSRKQVGEWMRASDCICVPSIKAKNGDEDGIPNVVVEAMATGLPVVGTLAGSLWEVLSRETGWPVESPTAENLAAALYQLSVSPDEARARAQRARALEEQMLDARINAKMRADLFENQ